MFSVRRKTEAGVEIAEFLYPKVVKRHVANVDDLEIYPLKAGERCYIVQGACRPGVVLEVSRDLDALVLVDGEAKPILVPLSQIRVRSRLSERDLGKFLNAKCFWSPLSCERRRSISQEQLPAYGGITALACADI
ncbi:MAG TPA: hypothetical protein VG820_00680, partial [Fimbriimonadaceae bacterium]|nr:hypothetical protein [Fimbriimonadaceae bacterium]